MKSQDRMMRTMQIDTKFTGGRRMKTQRHIVGVLLLGLVLFAGTQTAAAQATLFQNTNIDAVQNNPRSAPQFRLTVPTTITQLVTYHWNFGLGSRPGAIALRNRNNGRLFGPFAARGTSGQGGRANVNWIATVNVTLPAGQYTVLDSDPNTWSNNARSGFVGFAIVRGSAVPTPAPVPPTTPTDLGANNFFTATPLIPVASMPVVAPGMLAQTINDGIGGSDPDDWYKLTVVGPNGSQQARGVVFTLAGSASDMVLQLFAYDQVRRPFPLPPVQAGGLIATGGPLGSQVKVITGFLAPGNYAVHVSRAGAATSYALTISTPAP